MKKISLVLVLTFIFIGCSGKVQTNKIPDDKRYSLPKNYKQLNDREQLLEIEKVKYDEYARNFFKVQKNEEIERSIYYIGISRGHFDEKQN